MSELATLEELFATIQKRKKADKKKSYTAKLFAKGRKKIAQKVGEEGVEVVIDAIADNKKAVIAESSDLLYHLLVLWADMDIELAEVMEELEGRKK